MDFFLFCCVFVSILFSFVRCDIIFNKMLFRHSRVTRDSEPMENLRAKRYFYFDLMKDSIETVFYRRKYDFFTWIIQTMDWRKLDDNEECCCVLERALDFCTSSPQMSR